MTIRKALKKDIVPMAELQKKCFSIPLSEKDFLYYIENPDYCLIVADDNGNPAGHCLASTVGDSTEIISIAVDEKSRRKGFGEALIKEVIGESERKKKFAVLLEVRSSNIGAQSLYEKCGFKKIAVRKHFYELPAEDGYTMIFVINTNL